MSDEVGIYSNNLRDEAVERVGNSVKVLLFEHKTFVIRINEDCESIEIRKTDGSAIQVLPCSANSIDVK